MNVNAKKRIHYGVMAIAITSLQLLAYAVPASAQEYLGSDSVQLTISKDSTQAQNIEIERFGVVNVVFPIDGGYNKLSSGYGMREQACDACSTFHQGADFPMEAGSPIRSIFIGTVIKVEYEGGLGEFVEIKYGDLGITAVYAHMKLHSATVKVGDTVKSGEIIGQVGSTGTATVNHLHLGIFVDGYSIDPIPWLVSHHAVRYNRG